MSAPMPSSSVLKALAVMFQIYSRGYDAEDMKDLARQYAEDLASYPEPQVLQALARCRREMKSRPTIADIIVRMDDGRPGAEEAWAMIPKDEASSVIWTHEMRDAFGIARGLLADDPVAARMAFREAYLRLVAEARAQRHPTQWTPSLGLDREGRTKALQVAVHRKQLSLDQAKTFDPEFSLTSSHCALTSDRKEQAPDLSGLSVVMERLLANAPEGIRKRELARQRIAQLQKTELTEEEKQAELKELEIKKQEQLERLKAEEENKKPMEKSS